MLVQLSRPDLLLYCFLHLKCLSNKKMRIISQAIIFWLLLLLLLACIKNLNIINYFPDTFSIRKWLNPHSLDPIQILKVMSQNPSRFSSEFHFVLIVNRRDIYKYQNQIQVLVWIPSLSRPKSRIFLMLHNPIYFPPFMIPSLYS